MMAGFPTIEVLGMKRTPWIPWAATVSMVFVTPVDVLPRRWVIADATDFPPTDAVSVTGYPLRSGRKNVAPEPIGVMFSNSPIGLTPV